MSGGLVCVYKVWWRCTSLKQAVEVIGGLTPSRSLATSSSDVGSVDGDVDA